MPENKLIQLGPCIDPTDAAVQFELALTEILNHYMQNGLQVANAVGVLECVKSEMTVSFYAAKGGIDKRIKEVTNA